MTDNNAERGDSWKERLAIEHKELKDNFLKLLNYIHSANFVTLSSNNKQLLKNQKIVMELYLDILTIRMFEDVDAVDIPDYKILQLISNLFDRNIFGTKSAAEKYLEQKLSEQKA